MVHFDIKLTGLVQGIGLRYYTRMRAQALGLYGFVQNFPDGSVYIEIEGEERVIREFLNWLERGFDYGGPREVKIENGKIKNYKSFTIEH